MKKFILIFLAALCLAGCAAKDPKTPLATGDEHHEPLITEDLATEPPSTEPDRYPDEVEKLRTMLGNKVSMVTRERIEDYSFNEFENKPVGCYVLELKEDEPVYVRVYDSAETAADEAANYDGDGSQYSDGDSHFMMIDYAYPVHFWLSGNAIIEYGSSDDSVAILLRDFYGEQFAGAEIVEPGTLSGYTYSQVSASAGESALSDAEAIGSRSELEDYYSALKNSWYWSPYNEPQLSEFETKMEDYPADWFENRSLIIVYATSPTGPADFSVDGVTPENGGYTVIVSCNAGDDEMIVEKYVFIELEGVSLSRKTPVRLINAYDRLSPESADNRPRLTVGKLRELVESGKELSWGDFESYRYDDIGSGLYIRRYFMQDRGYMLMIGGGNTDEKPMYIRLARVYQDYEATCEIGVDDLESFLSEQGYNEVSK